MDPNDLKLLVESIDDLSSRVMWMTFALGVMYFSFLIGMFIAWIKSEKEENSNRRPLEDADNMLEEGKFVELENRCLRFITQKPNNIDAHWYLALSLYHQRKYAEAINSFETVNRINPHWDDNTSVYIEKSRELLGHGEPRFNH